MITQERNLQHIQNHPLERQIKIKENQLKIALDSDMPYVVAALQNQLSELKRQLLEPEDPDFEALMSLCDD